MADIALLASQADDAPLGYQVPGAQEIILKSITASFDGSGAAGAFIPTLQIIAPNGAVLAACPVSTSVAAGASADVSWFPRGGLGGSAPAGSGIFWPAADQADASYDTTTYPDNFSGSGFYDALVFSAELAAFAMAIAGDDYPRMFVASTMHAGGGVSGGIRMNDGTADPIGDGVAFGTLPGGPVGSPHALIQSNSSPWLFGGVDGQSTQPFAEVVNGLKLQRVQGSVVGGNVIHYAGNGAPTIGGNVGDKYWRADGTVGTTTLIYTCTVAGAPTFATWVGIL